MIPKPKTIKSKKIRNHAKGQECAVMIPGVCNHNPATTVLAHLGGGGMGQKTSDFKGSFCCNDCHGALDGRIKTPFSREELLLWHYQGIIRTWDILVRDGLIQIK